MVGVKKIKVSFGHHLSLSYRGGGEKWLTQLANELIERGHEVEIKCLPFWKRNRPLELDKEINTCGASDLMSDILAGLSEGCILLTGLTTVQVIRTAMVAGVGAVVFVRGKTPPKEVIDLAEGQALPLISSPYSMFVSCGRLHACELTGLDGRR